MKTSSSGLAFIQQFEGTRLKAYQDSIGVWTIGTGHTGSDVHAGLTITPAQATALLAKDLAAAEYAVNNAVHVALSQNAFDACVSFVFNCGSANFRSSTLLRKINAGDLQGAAAEFVRWDRAGGEVLPGLLRRREAEAKLIVKP